MRLGAPLLILLIHRLIARAAQGVAAQDAPDALGDADDETLLLYGLYHVFRTTGYVAAAAWQKGGYITLVYPDDAYYQKTHI